MYIRFTKILSSCFSHKSGLPDTFLTIKHMLNQLSVYLLPRLLRELYPYAQQLLQKEFFNTSWGISARSFLFSFGINTCVIPPRLAACNFSFNPPIGKTLPRKVTSPVIARSLRTGRPVRADVRAVAIVMPAEGPSLGTAPSGT